jgi:hypothetical protein
VLFFPHSDSTKDLCPDTDTDLDNLPEPFCVPIQNRDLQKALYPAKDLERNPYPDKGLPTKILGIIYYFFHIQIQAEV